LQYPPQKLSQHESADPNILITNDTVSTGDGLRPEVKMAIPPEMTPLPENAGPRKCLKMPRNMKMLTPCQPTIARSWDTLTLPPTFCHLL